MPTSRGAWSSVSLGLLAVSAALSGCVAPSPAATPPSGPGDLAGVTSWAALADAWLAEYWGPTNTRLLLDNDFASDTPQVNPGGTCAFCTFFGVEFGEVLVAWDTASLIFEVSEAQPSGMDYYALLHTASGAEHRIDLPGGAGSYHLAPGDADAPLQRRSFWSLTIHPYQAQGPPVSPGPRFTLTATATRAQEPAVLPPPAAWWGDAAALPLLDGEPRPVRAAVTPTGCTSCRMSWSPPEGAIVPPETGAVRGALEWDWAGPARPRLFLSSNGTEHARAVDLAEDPDGTRATFTFDVPTDWVDSPWQRRSTWVFTVVLVSDAGAAAASGSLRLWAEAGRAPRAPV